MKIDIRKVAARLCSGLTWSIPTLGSVNTLLSNWKDMCSSYEPWEMMEGLCLFLVSLDKDLIFTVSDDGVRFFVPTENGMSICIGCKFVDGVSVNSWPVFHRSFESVGRPLINDLSHHPWKKAMAWTINIAEAMGFNDVALGLYERASKCQREIVPVVSKLSPIVNEALMDVVGPNDEQGIFDVALASWNIPLGKIGSFKHKGKLPWGLLTINPRVFESPENIRHVIAHELVHAGLGPNIKDPHGKIFRLVAKKLGIPEKYQD